MKVPAYAKSYNRVLLVQEAFMPQAAQSQARKPLPNPAGASSLEAASFDFILGSK